MAISYEILKIVLQDTIYFNISWIISAIATLLTLTAITRDTNKWKELALPVMVIWHIAGIPPFFLLYIATAITFTIECLSIEVIGDLIKITKRPKPATAFQKELTLHERREARKKIKHYREGGHTKPSAQPMQTFTTEELREIRRRGL